MKVSVTVALKLELTAVTVVVIVVDRVERALVDCSGSTVATPSPPKLGNRANPATNSKGSKIMRRDSFNGRTYGGVLAPESG